MLRLKKLLKAILGLWLLLLPLYASPVYGSSPNSEVILTQQEFATLKQNYNEVLTTIDNQLTTINELEQQLKIAKLSTSESNQQLIEALNLINEQRKQLTEARNLLQAQEKMLNEQRISLAKAEAYLNMQKEEMKKTKSKLQKSTLLNIGLGLVSVYALAHK